MGKKKTHDEYIAEVANKNPNIEVVGEYINAHTKIKHRCKIDEYEWHATPNKILSGKGCPRCAGNIKKTHEEYVAEVLKVNPNIEVIGKYVNINTPILHKCKIHNVEWMAYPVSILRGSGCLKCGNEKIGEKFRKTHEQYIEEVKNISPHIVVLESYIDALTPILHRCTIHNIEWKAQPTSILNGSGCYECGIEKLKNQKLKSHEQYICELKVVNPNIIAIDNYIDSLTPILHKCLIDGYEWHVTPANALFGKGCPKCAGNARKTNDEYIQEVALINPDIEVVGQYVNSYTPILHKCLLDDNIWLATPSDILYGRGCPRCNKSKGEKYIRMLLEKYNVKYEPQKTFSNCRDVKPLPFDFYLPEYDKCIEFDGIQHFEPIDRFGGQDGFEYTIKHDKIKDNYCENNNIELLRIPYFKNIEEELNNFLFI